MRHDATLALHTQATRREGASAAQAGGDAARGMASGRQAAARQALHVHVL